MSGGHPPFFANAQVMMIEPTEVFVPKRIGFLHEDKAVAFGRLMAVSGQRDPIKVQARKGKQPWKLVTGRHRLRGAEIEGIRVTAIEVFGNDEDLAEMEASENLHRRPLGPIERAMFVQALCQAAQERIAREHGDLKQQKLAARARWERVEGGESTREQALSEETDDASDKMSLAYGWVESAADALNLGKRTINRALRLSRLVIEPFPDLVEALSRHPVVGENESQLRELADIADEGLRRATIEALLADPEIGVDDAKITAGVRQAPVEHPPQHVKYWSQVTGGWSRIGLGQKRQYLPRLAEMLDTPGLKLAMHELLTVEIEKLRAAGALENGDA